MRIILVFGGKLKLLIRINLVLITRKMFRIIIETNNRKTRKGCEICSKLTIKTPEPQIVNFEHISHLVPLTLNM